VSTEAIATVGNHDPMSRAHGMTNRANNTAVVGKSRSCVTSNS